LVLFDFIAYVFMPDNHNVGQKFRVFGTVEKKLRAVLYSRNICSLLVQNLLSPLPYLKFLG
jgi:hypothetical protein